VLCNHELSMTKLPLYLTLTASIFLVACGGESDSSELATNEDTSARICPTGATFEINGVELDTEIYDRDGSGCLSDVEETVATTVANTLLEQQQNGIVVDGVKSVSGISEVYSLKIIGSSEVSDGNIQLHSNIDSGDFHISLETYSTSSSDENLTLYFDDESVVDKAGEQPLFALSFPLPPLIGDISYVFACNYTSSMSINCTTLAVTETDNIGSSIMTLDIDVTIPLSLTFSEQSLPKAGYIIASFCDERSETVSCFKNYAEIPVSFN
jgi:hypothetical protein